MILEAQPEPGPSTRAEQRRRTRDRLVKTALGLFSRKGIMATRTIDLAREAHVSHGAVFLHFPTRDDLVAAVIFEFAHDFMRRIHDLAEGCAGVREVLEAHLQGISEGEDFYVQLVREGPVLPPYARSSLVGIQSAIAVHVARAAEREMAAGRIRAVSMPMLFNGWLGLLHHYLSNRDLFAPGASVLARHGRDLLEHYLGLLAP